MSDALQLADSSFTKEDLKSFVPFLRKHTGSVEALVSDQICRLYFPKPVMAEYLSEPAKLDVSALSLMFLFSLLANSDASLQLPVAAIYGVHQTAVCGPSLLCIVCDTCVTAWRAVHQ